MLHVLLCYALLLPIQMRVEARGLVVMIVVCREVRLALISERLCRPIKQRHGTEATVLVLARCAYVSKEQVGYSKME